MSRRERIALLEREGSSGGAIAPEVSALPSSAGPARTDESSSSCAGVPAEAAPVRENSVSRWRRVPRSDVGLPQQQARLPEIPSEQLDQMSRAQRIALLERCEDGRDASNQFSRRERIALLERAEGDERPDDAAVKRREDVAARSREDSATRRRGAGLREPSASSATNDEMLDSDEAWIEQRRQSRKMRLQQHTAGRNARSDASSGRDSPSGAGLAAADLETRVDAEPRAHRTVERRPPREGDSSSAPEVARRGAAREGPPAKGRLSAEDLEAIASMAVDDARWPELCHGIASGAHELSTGSLSRILSALAGATAKCSGRLPAGSPGMAAFHSAAEALLVCATPQLGTLGAVAMADALRIMAAARVEEQTYLDMLLAQLLVLLRRERASFSTLVLATIANALGWLQDLGLSAKRAASGASSAANRRCTEALSEQITKSLDEFGGEDLAQVGGSFIVAFMDDVQKRMLLRRAAEIQIGLCPETQRWLSDMQDIERVVRKHSFAFIASLPDQTKDYLIKVKAVAH